MPGNPDDEEKTQKFDWEILDITNLGISVLLEFENPLLVSQGDIQDSVDVILNLQDFKSQNGYKMKSDDAINIPIPR